MGESNTGAQRPSKAKLCPVECHLRDHGQLGLTPKNRGVLGLPTRG